MSTIRQLNFNPRPPCGGRPHAPAGYGPGRGDFNPRPPCGGRPHAPAGYGPGRGDFNPRPPCGGRLYALQRMGGTAVFQSTPPVWGATEGTYLYDNAGQISIHAPRVGGDAT